MVAILPERLSDGRLFIRREKFVLVPRIILSLAFTPLKK